MYNSVEYAPLPPQKPEWWEETTRAGFQAGGAALGAAATPFLPALGFAMGGGLGGAFGDMFNEFFDEEEEQQRMAQQQAPTPYLPQPMPYRSPGMPQNLSQQYGVQNPYGFG